MRRSAILVLVMTGVLIQLILCDRTMPKWLLCSVEEFARVRDSNWQRLHAEGHLMASSKGGD